MDGIHENILQLHYHDPMMRKTVSWYKLIDLSYLLKLDAFDLIDLFAETRHFDIKIIYLKVKSLNNLGVSELMQQYVMHSHRMQLLGKSI